MSSGRNCGRTVKVVLCLLSLLMLMTLPIQRAHQFQVHYRTSQIRRTFERHSELAASAQGGPEQLANEASHRPALSWILPEPASKPIIVSESGDQIPVSIPRLLVRLKLGMRSSGGQDSLVHSA